MQKRGGLPVLILVPLLFGCSDADVTPAGPDRPPVEETFIDRDGRFCF